jgi:cytochrome c553
MKYTTLLVALAALGLAACGNKQENMPQTAPAEASTPAMAPVTPTAPAPEASAPAPATQTASAAVPAGNAGETKFKTVCASCHGAQAQGMATFPKLAGQNAADLKAKLEKYRKGEKIGPMSATMMPMAKALSDQEVDDVTAYIATLK